MRILHVCPYFKPSWEAGGPPRFVYELASQQVAMGHEVTVYTTDGFKERVKVRKNTMVDVDGIKTYYFRNLSMYLTANFNIPLPYYLPVTAVKQIGSFDIIHVHEHRTFPAMVTSLLATKYNIPYIVQPHGSVPRMIKGWQKRLFDTLIGNRIIYNAKRIIASSKIESQYYKKVYPKLKEGMIIRVPNPVNIPKNIPKGLFKRKFGLEKNRIILYLGRIHERKGLDLLVRVFNQIKDDELKLVITGPDDHYLKRLKKLISELGLEDSILLTGPLYGSDKFEALVDADVFILPSIDKYESFGMAAAEAIACGTPVVVTSNCGISEWIDSTAGLIVKADEKRLRDAMKKILTDGSFHPRMPKIFEIERIARRFDEIYKDATK